MSDGRPAPRSVNGAARLFFVHVFKTAGHTFLAHARDNIRRAEHYTAHPWRAEEPLPDEFIRLRRFLSKLEPGLLAARTDDEQASLRCIDGHFPLAAAELMRVPVDRVVVVREPVARTVSQLDHLRRLRPETSDTPLEEIYDDPMMFGGLVKDLQTKILSLDLEEALRPRAADPDLGAARSAAIELAVARTGEEQQAALDGLRAVCADDWQSSMVTAAANFEPRALMDLMGTAATAPFDSSPERLQRALDVLPDIEVLGVTEQLDELMGTMAERYGWRLEPLRKLNTGRDARVSDSLRRRIVADCAADLELYEAARAEVAARRATPRYVSAPPGPPS
ncbi:MAG: sulfotransferase family 2 domain-containing protein [Acidimicrobiia bacterium]|nr:sulfotransferase family 2 domain-containing protein [Acidimicrobiia bacterium]